MKTIVTLFFAMSLLGCGTLPKAKDYSIPLHHFGTKAPQVNVDATDYVLQADDVLDVLYHFDTLSNELYLIEPHDKLNVMFLTASEYDNIHQVRPDGYISLPFVGDVKVAGISVDQAKSTIKQLYKPILKDPSFFVSLVEYQVHLKEIRASLDHPNMGQARLITVRQDQKISLPMIGDISIKDKSVSQLREEANARYAKINKRMSIDVLLQKSHARQIFVFGEVNNPGGHRVSGSTSLFQAIAMAGGANHDAELRTVVALRKENNEMVAKVFNVKNALNGKGGALTAMLSPEDVIYVPRTRLSNTAQVMRNISDIMMFRGVGATLSYRIDDPTRFEDDNE